MKSYQLSDDRTVTVKKKESQWTVIIKQKDSLVKLFEFTPNRCEYYIFKILILVFLSHFSLLP